MPTINQLLRVSFNAAVAANEGQSNWPDYRLNQLEREVGSLSVPMGPMVQYEDRFYEPEQITVAISGRT